MSFSTRTILLHTCLPAGSVVECVSPQYYVLQQQSNRTFERVSFAVGYDFLLIHEESAEILALGDDVACKGERLGGEDREDPPSLFA